ncbi:hypothetical protein D9M69_585150 [compost metagenome]
MCLTLGSTFRQIQYSDSCCGHWSPIRHYARRAAIASCCATGDSPSKRPPASCRTCLGSTDRKACLAATIARDSIAFAISGESRQNEKNQAGGSAPAQRAQPRALGRAAVEGCAVQQGHPADPVGAVPGTHQPARSQLRPRPLRRPAARQKALPVARRRERDPAHPGRPRAQPRRVWRGRLHLPGLLAGAAL